VWRPRSDAPPSPSPRLGVQADLDNRVAVEPERPIGDQRHGDGPRQGEIVVIPGQADPRPGGAFAGLARMVPGDAEIGEQVDLGVAGKRPGGCLGSEGARAAAVNRYFVYDILRGRSLLPNLEKLTRLAAALNAAIATARDRLEARQRDRRCKNVGQGRYRPPTRPFARYFCGGGPDAQRLPRRRFERQRGTDPVGCPGAARSSDDGARTGYER
jgi:transcriptional regulator with XRE-family HTH domain